jgi:hypothetical protein
MKHELQTRKPRLAAALASLALMVCVAAHAQGPDSVSRPAGAWQPTPPEKVKTQVLAAIAAMNVDAAARAKAEAVWADVAPAAPEDDLLTRVARTFALVSPNGAKLVSLCSGPRTRLVISSQKWLRDRGVPPVFAHNMRLFYAQWLVHESLFDEAQEQLSGLSPGEVVAPAALLFNQSVVYRALLNKELGLKTIDELLRGGDASPRRYAALARLMEDDLKGLKDDSLDHIARQMDDIRRRLDLGRAGPTVRTEQKGVVASLDKMIKAMEDQEQQHKEKEGSGAVTPKKPAKDSRYMEGKGPGNVAGRDIGSGEGWGNLPPKEREQAMQQIGRDFPSHYRDVIEQYFRRLAAEGSEENKK